MSTANTVAALLLDGEESAKQAIARLAGTRSRTDKYGVAFKQFGNQLVFADHKSKVVIDVINHLVWSLGDLSILPDYLKWDNMAASICNRAAARNVETLSLPKGIQYSLVISKNLTKLLGVPTQNQTHLFFHLRGKR